jgi:Bifunctional DNA primase/polymerase, N-terminal/Primase C terminal 2 (PriCT-2)
VLATLPVFACNSAKEPIIAGGFKSAQRTRSSLAQTWPLVAFATGERSGIDVLDVDPTGRDWYDANFDALPETRAHTTQRGLHLLFKHAPGLRCSTSRIAPGIDVRADGGYAIWWPREGLPFEDHPLCEWPEWLLAEAMTPKRGAKDASLSTGLSIPIIGIGAALHKLDPVGWRKQFDRWFALMMACKTAGISAEEFIAWSTRDPVYAEHGEKIARLWNGAPARHSGALFAAFKDAGIKVGGDGKASTEARFLGTKAKQPHWRSRLRGAIDWLGRNATERGLFSAACLVGEIMVEHRQPTPSAAIAMLLSECKHNGLVKLIGEEGCRKTIVNGFAHVEAKEIVA